MFSLNASLPLFCSKKHDPLKNLVFDEKKNLDSISTIEKEALFKKIMAIVEDAEAPVEVLKQLLSSWTENEAFAVASALRKLPVKNIEEAKKAAAELECAFLLIDETDRNADSLGRVCELIQEYSLYFLERFIETFGIGVFFSQSEDEFEAMYRSNQFFVITSFISSMAAFFTFLGEMAIPVFGALALTIALLSVLYPKIKPIPTSLPRATNLSKEAYKVSELSWKIRRDIIDKLAAALQTEGSLKKHPLLLGKTGVGKTECVKALAKAIESGSYEKLKGKKVFYFNASKLNQQGVFGGNRFFDTLLKQLANHKNDVILVFDEIHAIFSTKTVEGKLSDQLKTLLDSGGKGFPYIIGLTTEEEFSKYILAEDRAMVRRFEGIAVDSIEPRETKQLLAKEWKKIAPGCFLEEGVLDKIITDSKDLSDIEVQPAASLNLLNKCAEVVYRRLKSDPVFRSETEENLPNLENLLFFGKEDERAPATLPASGKTEDAKDTILEKRRRLFSHLEKAACQNPPKNQAFTLFVHYCLLPGIRDLLIEEKSILTSSDVGKAVELMQREKEKLSLLLGKA